jgi:sigma54-dependent transcription regulator
MDNDTFLQLQREWLDEGYDVALRVLLDEVEERTNSFFREQYESVMRLCRCYRIKLDAVKDLVKQSQ